MPEKKHEKREENALVTIARYSEIGFMIPAAVFVGYLLGLGADQLFHTHWINFFGIFFGAVVGFISMIRRALQSGADEDQDERDGKNDVRRP